MSNARASERRPILPGAIIGVLGSGQLGRMFAIAARRMGYRVHTYSPDSDTPTGQVADEEIVAPYDDLDRVSDFARKVDVVTFEFENVPAATAAAAAEMAPVRPDGSILHITQQRLREKSFLSRHGLPVTPFRQVRSRDELKTALGELGCPAVLKTADFGYDGKGQVLIESADQIERIPLEQAGQWVLEAFVAYQGEYSVVAARTADGTFTSWPLIHNTHANHILDTSVSPAAVDPTIARDAEEIARTVLEQLGVVGVLCVEFFLGADGRLLINELAPRPHNSGHLTFDASLTSQFEQQLRAVCGLPLGSTELVRPAAMANLLGEVWQNGEPNWPAACAVPQVKLHLYGKLTPRPGRKMGHLTALASTPDEALSLVTTARAGL